MKKDHFAIAVLLFTLGLAACGNESGSTATTESTTTVSDSNAATNMNNDTAGTATTTTPTETKAPLGAADSTFVMKAAMGGMMEVESSKIAQQNAQSERVKAFANMMVNDHTTANNELMTLAQSRGMTLPAALPADKQKHIDDMKGMTGKAFDKHYISMMMNDHKKDVAEFEKQSNSGEDAELKSWAAKTLPVLKTHRDSVQALSKMK